MTTSTTHPNPLGLAQHPDRPIPRECQRYAVLAQNRTTGQHDIIAMAMTLEIAISAANALWSDPTVGQTWENAQIWEHWFDRRQAKCIGHMTTVHGWRHA